jgi:hypothetical protein
MAIKYDPILDALREADTSGSSDTASNLGTGTGIFSNKNSGVFYFNSLATSTTIGVSGPTSGNITLNLLSIPTSLIPDPLTVNNLSVLSQATITAINTDYITFDTSITTSPLEGQINWNDDAKTLEIGLKNNFPLEVGMQTIELCVNKTGVQIDKGKVVYINGGQGNRPTITLADNSSDATSARTFGVVAEDIPNNNSGYVVSSGLVYGLNTNAYTAGTLLYLGTSGNMTSTKPQAPTHMVYVAKVVTQSSTVGVIHVAVMNGLELNELHDVQITTPVSDKSVIAWESSSNLWKNISTSTLKTNLDLSGTNTGDVTVTDSSTIDFTLTGQALTGSVIPGGINHNDLGSKQGGTTGEYYHLTNAQLTNLGNQSGTNTGDVTVTDSSTIDFTLTGQALTGSVIQSGITHNNLGSLQGGTAGEYNHLTNAQVTNLNNQSGTNTGDETKTSIETKLGVASSTNSGYLSSTDWSTFNGKLTPNSPITGATKTKITYDSNGLVTAGADATTADIADSTNKRYVTDADLTTLLNTSGTNTGDITVIDSSTIDFTLTGQTLTASTKDGGIQHNSLLGLTTGDVHTQYALLAGRSGGQTLTGGTAVNNLLILRGTSANGNTATNNAIRFGTGNGGGTYTMNIRQDGAVDMTTTTTSSANALSVTNNISGTSGDSIGALFNVTDSGGGVKTIYGHRARIRYAGGPGNSISGVQATSNQVVVDTGGTATAVEVLTSNLEVTNNSVVSDAKLIRLFAPTVNTGGSIGNLIGLDLPALTQGTTNWSIYSDGADMYHKGNVGIGAVPTSNRVLVLSDTKNSTLAYIQFQEGTTKTWSAGTQSGEFHIYDDVNAAYRFTIEPTGEVGIGVTNPTQRLEVGGRIRMNTWTADGDTVAYRDTATNCIAIATSDLRLKKDLEVIPNALDKVKSLSGYTYRKIDDEANAKKRYGVIAQEVLAVAPELTFEFTNEDDPNTYYSVHYDKLPALLIEAIKDQQVIIETLKSEVEILKGQING